MIEPAPRPTTEVRDVILDSMDRMFDQLVDRLDGLTNEEYLWEPVPGMWSVRTTNGKPTVEGAGVRDLDLAPATTLAWRLWHLALDCLDDYTRRFAGDPSDAPAIWTLDAGQAIETLRDRWAAYRQEVVRRDWWSQLGEDWEPWSSHSVAGGPVVPLSRGRPHLGVGGEPFDYLDGAASGREAWQGQAPQGMLAYIRRTTVKLPDELDARLRHEAQRRGTTVSALTREAIETLLAVPHGRRRLLASGAGASGRDDISERIEEILASEVGSSH